MAGNRSPKVNVPGKAVAMHFSGRPPTPAPRHAMSQAFPFAVTGMGMCQIFQVDKPCPRNILVRHCFFCAPPIANYTTPCLGSGVGEGSLTVARGWLPRWYARGSAGSCMSGPSDLSVVDDGVFAGVVTQRFVLRYRCERLPCLVCHRRG